MPIEENFSNEQVHTEYLPTIDHINFKSLHKEYLTAQIIGSGIFWLIITIGITTILLFKHEKMPTVVVYTLPIVAFLILCLHFFLTIKGFKRKQYGLRERDIIYKHGLIWRSTTIIPFNRVQHAEVEQGPIERLFDLSRLKVYTAGGSSSDLSISGIRLEEAHAMKFFIMNKTALDEEE